MIYLSQLMGNPVFAADGEKIGTVSDLGIATGEVFPRVTSLAFKGPGRTPFMISWRKYVDTYDEKEIHLKVPATEIRFSYLQPDEVLIARDILNKQIVDTRGMRVVRVNDLKLSDTNSTQLRLLGAEVGARGILRSLSPALERTVLRLARAFGKPMPERIIAWSYMDLVERDLSNVKLSVSHKTLDDMHPADIADIIERLDPRLRGQVFAQLDDEQRAWALQNRYRLLSQMEGYCNTTGCLREYMLRYFGDEAAAEHAAAGADGTADEAEGCGNCSNCLTQFEVEDVTDMARVAVRYVAVRPMRFGKSLIADVLHGGNTERIRQMHLDEDRGYGELSSESVGRIKDIIGQLCGRGYLATSQGQYPVVGLGPRAGEVEDETFAFTVKRRASKRKASARARRAVDLLREEAELDQRPRVGDDAELFERLRALRKEISTELEMAPYMVFSDKALRGLCRLRPQTRDELIQVNGIGEKKAESFGEQFMAAIEEFESEHARDGA